MRIQGLEEVSLVRIQVNAVVHTLSEEALVESLEAAGGAGLLEGMPVRASFFFNTLEPRVE